MNYMDNFYVPAGYFPYMPPLYGMPYMTGPVVMPAIAPFADRVVDAPREEQMPAPLKPELPHVLLPKREEMDECSITTVTYKQLAQNNDLIQTPCGHKFSRKELEKWLDKDEKHSCPMCRAFVELDKCVLVDLDTSPEKVEVPPPVSQTLASEKNRAESHLVQEKVQAALDKTPVVPPKEKPTAVVENKKVLEVKKPHKEHKGHKAHKEHKEHKAHKEHHHHKHHKKHHKE